MPAAKITEKKKLSIVTNYMGTPETMYNDLGEKTWKCSLSSYGKVRNFKGDLKTDCPFRYQGKDEDNRFRHSSPDDGMFISQGMERLAKLINKN